MPWWCQQGEQCLTILDRRPAEVFAVEFEAAELGDVVVAFHPGSHHWPRLGALQPDH